MQNLGHINNAINQNKQMYTKMTSAPVLQQNIKSNSLNATQEVQYYNDELIVNKENKKKKRKILLGSLIGVSVLATAGTIAYEIAKGKINVNFSKIAENTTQKVNKAKDSLMESNVAKQTKSGFVKTLNAMVNFSNIKDDLFTRYFNFKPLNIVNTYLENIYNGFSKSKYKNFNESLETVKKHAEKLGIKNLDFNFAKWFDEMSNGIKDSLALTPESKGKRITEGLLSDTKGQKFKERAKYLYEKMTNSVLSEDKLAEVKKECLNKAQFDFGEITIPDKLYSLSNKEAQEALGKLKAQVAQKTGLEGDELEKLAKAIKEVNYFKTKGANELIERTRDTSLGNASTDMLGIVASLGLLGGAVANTDTKEEKKETIINLGIPLITTLASAIYATAKCYSGGVALLFGIATGQAATALANGTNKVSKAIAQKNEEKQNLELKA